MTESLPSAAGDRRRLPFPSLRLGWNEGDAWTVGIGLSLALVLAVATIPAVLDARGAAPLAGTPSAAEPFAPADPGQPAEPPIEAVAPPPAVPLTQPLLGPLVPLGPITSVGGELRPAADPSVPGATGPAPLAPGEVRQFAVLPSRGLAGAVAAAVDGTVWAGTDVPAEPGAPSELVTWDAAGVLRGTAQVPEQPADRTRGLTGMVSLPDGTLAAVDAATSRLLRYDPQANPVESAWSTLAEIPDVPPCLVLTPAPCQPGLLDTPPLLRGIAVDGSGTIYVADAGQGIIWRQLPGKPIKSWFSSADVAGPEGLAGLAVDAEGHLRAVVTRLADLQGTAAGALLRINRAEDGSAGARTVVAAFRAGEDAVDVALGASGNAYVALRGVDAVVTLDSTGFEQLRVADDALADPTAVHLVAGRVLVTSAAPVPAVLEIGVDDTPLVPASAPSTAGGSARG